MLQEEQCGKSATVRNTPRLWLCGERAPAYGIPLGADGRGVLWQDHRRGFGELRLWAPLKTLARCHSGSFAAYLRRENLEIQKYTKYSCNFRPRSAAKFLAAPADLGF